MTHATPHRVRRCWFCRVILPAAWRDNLCDMCGGRVTAYRAAKCHCGRPLPCEGADHDAMAVYRAERDELKARDATRNRVQDGSAEWLLGHAACFIRECQVDTAGMTRLYNHLEKLVAHAIPNRVCECSTPQARSDDASVCFKCNCPIPNRVCIACGTVNCETHTHPFTQLPEDVADV